jgi:hypothetical protein
MLDVDALGSGLDGALYVRQDGNLLLAWHGGCGVGVINMYTGRECGHWTIGNAKGDKPTLDEVRNSMERRMETQEYPY